MMSLETEWIRYGENGEYSGYLARLSGVKEAQPSVIVLQEIWGVDDHIQDVVRRFARAGYIAFAPDLFSRNGERPELLRQDRIDEGKKFLNSLPPGVWQDPERRQAALDALPEARRGIIAGTLGQVFGVGGMIPDFVRQCTATSQWLRETYEYSYGKGVASVGFCLGGGLSIRLASQDPKLSGAVIFYGSAPIEETVPTVGCPVIGFYGELDKRLTEGVPALAQAFEEAGKPFEFTIYPGAQHAFFNDTRPSYNVEASRDAFVGTLDFLRKVLAG